MTTIKAIRLAAVAAVTVLAAGCGTERPGDDTGAVRPSRAAAVTPTTPLDFPCPGETATPAPPASADTGDPSVPPTDHYAENHGFMVPFPPHGQVRCDGIAAVGRIEDALEPLRERGDFDPENTRGALIGLGYPEGVVRAYQNGPTGVGFAIDTYPLCLEGTLDRATTKADAFSGYPDHAACDRPSGGH
ncbi:MULTISPECIES: hypothetical protein [unclassified Streptomyces]|uniref:hypothetical protein n=1 Tax=unclassified Streptomyces TaxID=2593676 RepID=UPI002E2C8484|nr:hypothetical protein [Streptomyces sp. NBC_00223]